MTSVSSHADGASARSPKSQPFPLLNARDGVNRVGLGFATNRLWAYKPDNEYWRHDTGFDLESRL